MANDATANRNGHQRWADVFSDAAWNAAQSQVAGGGTLDTRDAARGLTVDRLKAALQRACPGEPLPDDNVIELRLLLLGTLVRYTKLLRSVDELEPTIAQGHANLELLKGLNSDLAANLDYLVELNSIGRELVYRLEQAVGEPVGETIFSKQGWLVRK